MNRTAWIGAGAGVLLASLLTWGLLHRTNEPLPPGPSSPSVTLPAEVAGQPGAFVRITATTTGRCVQWYSPDAGLNIWPPEDLRDSKRMIAVAPAKGRFRLVAWSAAGDVPSEAAVCVVVIGDVPPGPGPGPVPPTPPEDPLLTILQPLYAADSNPQKTTYRASLAALYRQAVHTTNDGSLKTAGDLLGTMKRAVNALMPPDALGPVRDRLAPEIDGVLGTKPDMVLDAAYRENAAKLFGRIATALEGLK